MFHKKTALETEREAHDIAPPSPIVIHESLLNDGEEMIVRPTHSLMWSGLSAGLSMGFAVVAASVIHWELQHVSWNILAVALGATLGYLIVILGRQGLITESALVAALPVLSESRRYSLSRATAVILIIALANIVGAFLFAALLAQTELLESKYKASVTALATLSTDPSFMTLLIRGVLGGWAIALAVWTAPAAGSARVVTIFLLAYFTGLAHFSHLAVVSIESFYLILSGLMSPLNYVVKIFPAVLVGNLVGGVVLVAVLNHLQVAKERKELIGGRLAEA